MPRSRIRRYLRHGMLPQLAVFEAVCRLHSYTRAAEELCIAQPTVSTQMKKLADALGVPLIESNGKRFAVTDAGRELAAACQDIFQRLERVEERLIALRGLEHGRLRVGASSAAKEFMTRLLGRFCARYPTIEVSLHIDNWQGMRNRLRENEDDLYVLLTAPDEPELVSYPFRPHRIELYASVHHRLAGSRALDPAQFATEPFILREPGSATRRIAEELCARWGIAPRVRMELSSNETIKQALLDGLGIAFLAHDVAGEEPGLRPLDVAGLPVVQPWLIAHPKARPLSQVGAAFLAHVRAHAHQEAANSSPAPRAAA